MAINKTDNLSSWARLLEALGSLTSKIIWSIVAVVILTGIGRYLYFSSQTHPNETGLEKAKTTAPMHPPIPWHEVDQALVAALKASHKAADTYASKTIDHWAKDLEQRIDKDFLDWYFSYLQQQWLGLKALGYWTAQKLLDEQPSVAERIAADIQEEFSKRVLRPQIAQMQIERIVEETLREYLKQVQHHIASIPQRHKIPQVAWDRYLSDIAVLTSGSEGNREIALSLKVLTTSSLVGSLAGVAYLASTLKPVVAKIGTSVSARAAAKGAGEAAAKLATQTGMKIGVKMGGKFLGPIIGMGVLIWDAWDHQHTEKVERPILRKNLMDYLQEVKHSLLYNPEAGVMTTIDLLEGTMIASLNSE
ncbi:hypothetical protein NKDENANG_02525 [Candidatus Entotheonellaceae bacterium PAL068K]